MRKNILFTAVLTLAATAYFATPSRSEGKTENVTVDGVHSSVIFRVKYFDASFFYGNFLKVSGTISTVDGGSGKASLTIDAGSVFTGSQDRDKHLRSPDFFDAKQFPNIEFSSDDVKHVGGDKYEANGKLTMRGVTKELTITFERTGTGKGRKGEARTGFHGTFTVKRSDFGVKYMVGPLSDEVVITAALAGLVQ